MPVVDMVGLVQGEVGNERQEALRTRSRSGCYCDTFRGMSHEPAFSASKW